MKDEKAVQSGEISVYISLRQLKKII